MKRKIFGSMNFLLKVVLVICISKLIGKLTLFKYFCDFFCRCFYKGIIIN